MTLDDALARIAALEREGARLKGELDAAEQHVTILQKEVARLAPKGTDADPERSDYTDPDDE